MRISDWSSDVCSSDLTLDAKWSAIRSAREEVTEAIEPLRREKTIRSSLEAEVSMGEIAEAENIDFAEICIVAKVDMQPGSEGVCVKPSDYHKCGRCWRLLPEVPEDGALCERCERWEEHTTKLQSLMRISYAVFCLKTKKK